MKRSRRNSSELSEIQLLKKKIKELEAQKKSLLKQIKQFERQKHIYDDYMLTEGEAEEPETPINACPKCYKGITATIDLGIKWLTSCAACGYRKVEAKK